MPRRLLTIVAAVAGLLPWAAFGQVYISQPSGDETYYQRHHTVTVGGSASGDVERITWRCERGCGQSGTARGTRSWDTSGTTIYLEGGSNIIRVTAHHADGSTSTDSINVYRTIAQRENVRFPYRQDFDDGPETVEGRINASAEDGGRVVHTTNGCWRGGCVYFKPSTPRDTYTALGGYSFAGEPRRFHMRYLIKFGPDFVDNLNLRMKHILAHRATDQSGDRAMVYVWGTTDGRDKTFGACDNTVCAYEGGKSRPDGSETFLIGDYLDQWVNVEAVFDSAAHKVRVYITTPDQKLRDYLIAEQDIHAVSSSRDYWNQVSILGAYIDLGTTPSEGMYWMIDELAIDDDYIGPPPGYLGGRDISPPAPPVLRKVQ